MKIVQYREPFLPVIGGAELSVDYLGKYFVKKGHQVTVLTMTPGHVDSYYNIVRLNSSLKVLLWLTKSSYDIINIHNYSIRFSLAHGTFIFYPLYILRKIKKTPIVFTLRGSKKLYQKLKMWDRICYEMKNSDFIIFNAYYMLKYAKELNLNNYAYIPNLVDTSLFYPQEPSKELLNSLNLSSKFVILTISRLDPERNVELVLEVAKMLKVEKDIVFLVIGSGLYEKHLKNLAQKWALQNVIFVGKVPNTLLPKFLSIADVFLNPLNLPELGRGMLEAMACEKAVLKKSIEDDPLLKDEKNFIKYDDISDLVGKILTLRSDKDLVVKIGKEARKFVLNNCSIDITGSKTEKIYERLIR